MTLSLTKQIELRVNGARVTAEVEPRLQLADFLRDHLLLTGTHLGCEHGVCGACTIEIDGAPARSCITYAVACSGSDVRTIEGFEDDRVMADLREAFSAHHALQCGYCTPGMLVTARDIVLRLRGPDEARIRKELAGNLCRCTGYVGIVRAIQSVIAKRGETAQPAPVPAPEAPVQPAAPAVPIGRQTTHAATPKADRAKGGNRLQQSFTVDHPREKVWAFFARLDEVTLCLPGASVTATPAPDRVETRLRLKLGPIAAEFDGTAEAERDRTSCSGVIHGSARDARSSSTTRGEIRYALHEEKGGAATRVDVEVEYTLTGTLAQFGRSGIVQDIARRMTAAFARNLEARLNEPLARPDEARSAQRSRAELDAGSLFRSVVWNRIKRFCRSLLGRGP